MANHKKRISPKQKQEAESIYMVLAGKGYVHEEILAFDYFDGFNIEESLLNEWQDRAIILVDKVEEFLKNKKRSRKNANETAKLKSAAKMLYMNTELDIQTISDMINTTYQNVNNWKNQEKWEYDKHLIVNSISDQARNVSSWIHCMRILTEAYQEIIKETNKKDIVSKEANEILDSLNNLNRLVLQNREENPDTEAYMNLLVDIIEMIEEHKGIEEEQKRSFIRILYDVGKTTLKKQKPK